MPRYLISFPSGAMAHIPAEELPAGGEAAHAAVQAAMDAGVWACRCAREIREFMPDPAVGN
jgi:hypothetical protein